MLRRERQHLLLVLQHAATTLHLREYLRRGGPRLWVAAAETAQRALRRVAIEGAVGRAVARHNAWLLARTVHRVHRLGVCTLPHTGKSHAIGRHIPHNCPASERHARTHLQQLGALRRSLSSRPESRPTDCPGRCARARACRGLCGRPRTQAVPQVLPPAILPMPHSAFLAFLRACNDLW